MSRHQRSPDIAPAHDHRTMEARFTCRRTKMRGWIDTHEVCGHPITIRRVYTDKAWDTATTCPKCGGWNVVFFENGKMREVR